MVISNNIENVITQLVSNIDFNKMVFVGGITDYFHFMLLGVNDNMVVSDIDILIKTIEILNEIENVLGVNARLVDCYGDVKQYYIKLNNGIHIDIFMESTYDVDNVTVVTFNTHQLNILPVQSRLISLSNTIDKECRERSTNKIILKYLKKKLMYINYSK